MRCSDWFSLFQLIDNPRFFLTLPLTFPILSLAEWKCKLGQFVQMVCGNNWASSQTNCLNLHFKRDREQQSKSFNKNSQSNLWFHQLIFSTILIKIVIFVPTSRKLNYLSVKIFPVFRFFFHVARAKWSQPLPFLLLCCVLSVKTKLSWLSRLG